MSHSVKLRLMFWISGQYEKIARRAMFGPTKSANSPHSRNSRAMRGCARASTLGCASEVPVKSLSALAEVECRREVTRLGVAIAERLQAVAILDQLQDGGRVVLGVIDETSLGEGRNDD